MTGLLINPYRFTAPAGGGGGTYSAEVLADSPAAYWRLGESSGSTMTDSSGNNRNGTYYTTTLGATGLLSTGSDTAASWAGTGAATVAHSAWLDSTDWTAECLFKPSTVTGTQTVFARYISGASFALSRWSVRMDGNVLRFYSFTAEFGSHDIGTVTAGTTYHLAIVYVGSTSTVTPYLNAVAGTSAVRGMNAASSPFTIAAAVDTTNGSGGERFSGTIDEVAYYPTALSGARIAAHYAAA